MVAIVVLFLHIIDDTKILTTQNSNSEAIVLQIAGAISLFERMRPQLSVNTSHNSVLTIGMMLNADKNACA